MEVIDDAALVPSRNHVAPPDRFSHELTEPAPYWFDGAGSKNPDGELPAGTPVLLTIGDNTFCRVIDERGLFVQVRCEVLRPLTEGD